MPSAPCRHGGAGCGGARATRIRVPPAAAHGEASDNRLGSGPIRRHRASRPHLHITRARITARPLHPHRRRDRHTLGNSRAQRRRRATLPILCVAVRGQPRFRAGDLDELEHAAPPAGPALRNSGGCDALRTLCGCGNRRALCRRPCPRRRSRMVSGGEHRGCVHPARHHRRDNWWNHTFMVTPRVYRRSR